MSWASDIAAAFAMYADTQGVREREATRECPECHQTGHGEICHHWDINGERKVPTMARDSELQQQVTTMAAARPSGELHVEQQAQTLEVATAESDRAKASEAHLSFEEGVRLADLIADEVAQAADERRAIPGIRFDAEREVSE